MTRNQKMALGCGAAGCLALIVVIIAIVVLSALGYMALPGTNGNYNYNYNTNSNSNRSSTLNSNSDSNSNTSSESSSMSDDDKHRLYQAAGMTKDSALMQRVIRKIGLGEGTGADHETFIKDHFRWAMKNLDFIQSVNTPEKARAYVDEHIDD